MKNYYSFIFKSQNQNRFLSLYLIIRFFFFRKLSFFDKKFFKKYLKLNEHNLNFKKKGKYTQDWFSYNIKYISRVIYKYDLQNKNLNILEIGSYEGLSTVFFLSLLKNSKITCIDPFEDFEENKDKDFNLVLENFLFNTKEYKNRVELFKGISDDFFKNNSNEEFDLIYIDGSHHSENVFKDAKNSFNRLKKRGIIIFDDFLWHYKQNMKSSITFAIIEFLHKNKKNLKILYSNYQIMVEKV